MVEQLFWISDHADLWSTGVFVFSENIEFYNLLHGKLKYVICRNYIF